MSPEALEANGGNHNYWGGHRFWCSPLFVDAPCPFPQRCLPRAGEAVAVLRVIFLNA